MKVQAIAAAALVMLTAASAHAEETVPEGPPVELAPPAVRQYLDDHAAAEQKRSLWLAATGVAAGAAFTGLGTAVLARGDGRSDPVLGGTLMGLGVVSFVGALFILADHDHSALAARSRRVPGAQLQHEWATLADARATRRKLAGAGVLAVSLAALAGAGYLTFHEPNDRSALEAAPLYALGGLGTAMGVAMLAGRSDTEESLAGASSLRQ